MTTPATFRVVSAWPEDCPTCHKAGAVIMVSADGRIRAECLGSLGSNFIYADEDVACHGSYEVDPEMDHWIVRETGAQPDPRE